MLNIKPPNTIRELQDALNVFKLNGYKYTIFIITTEKVDLDLVQIDMRGNGNTYMISQKLEGFIWGRVCTELM